MTLTEFLLARIAEDEAEAQAVIADMPRWDEPEWGEDGSLPAFAHINRWSPARALAECEAKRDIVEWWGDMRERLDREDACRMLAAVYADHPDYQREWGLDFD